MQLIRNGGQKQKSVEFGITNSILSTIIKNHVKIPSLFVRNMFEPERKQMSTAKHWDLETAVLNWFKQARSQNAPIWGLLLLEKADELAKQMSIEFLANQSWLERFRKGNSTVLKNVGGETNNVLPTMIIDCLHSTLPPIFEESPKMSLMQMKLSCFILFLSLKLYSLKDSHAQEEKSRKRKITVLVGCNSDGS